MLENGCEGSSVLFLMSMGMDNEGKGQWVIFIYWISDLSFLNAFMLSKLYAAISKGMRAVKLCTNKIPGS